MYNTHASPTGLDEPVSPQSTHYVSTKCILITIISGTSKSNTSVRAAALTQRPCAALGEINEATLIRCYRAVRATEGYDH